MKNRPFLFSLIVNLLCLTGPLIAIYQSAGGGGDILWWLYFPCYNLLVALLLLTWYLKTKKPVRKLLSGLVFADLIVLLLFFWLNAATYGASETTFSAIS